MVERAARGAVIKPHQSRARQKDPCPSDGRLPSPPLPLPSRTHLLLGSDARRCAARGWRLLRDISHFRYESLAGPGPALYSPQDEVVRRRAPSAKMVSRRCNTKAKSTKLGPGCYELPPTPRGPSIDFQRSTPRERPAPKCEGDSTPGPGAYDNDLYASIGSLQSQKQNRSMSPPATPLRDPQVEDLTPGACVGTLHILHLAPCAVRTETRA